MEQLPYDIALSDVASAIGTEEVNYKVIKKNKEKKQYLETSFQFVSHADSNYGEEGSDEEDGEDYDDLEAELLGEGGGGSHSGNSIISENTMNKKINLR
jgi:hypothetical protein